MSKAKRKLPPITLADYVLELSALPDADLSKLIQDAEAVVRDRAHALPFGDPLAAIHGQEAAKRALLVAISGNHSILFVGGPDTGKSMLRAVAVRVFGFGRTFEARPCRCGLRNDPRVACLCDVSSVESYVLTWPKADMRIECPPVPAKYMQIGGGWSGVDVFEKQLAKAAAHSAKLTPDRTARELLEHATRDLGLTVAQRGAALRIGATIAKLDQADSIHGMHVAEAVNYLPRPV